MKKLLLLFGLMSLSVLACDKSEIDVQSPTAQFLNLDPIPAEGLICGSIEDTVFHLTGGESLQFEIRFSDNMGLSQYKIDIHNNFDCHGHGGSAPGTSVPDVNNLTEDWTILDIVDLSGKEETIDRSLIVPENVTAGNYHFQIQVLDESGNDDPLANFYSLSVQHPDDNIVPEIQVDIPANSSFSATKGETVHFEGTITDNYSLSQGGNGVLYLTYTDLNSGNTFNSDIVIVFDQSVETEYNFSFDYEIPTTIVAGGYILSVRGLDGVRNVAEPVDFMVEIGG